MTDYATLVKWLREPYAWRGLSLEAADAIEALVKAKGDLAEQSNEWCGIAEREAERAEAAEAEAACREDRKGRQVPCEF